MVVTAPWKRVGGSAVATAADAAALSRDHGDLGALVAAAKAGDPGALGRLFDAARGYLLAIASR